MPSTLISSNLRLQSDSSGAPVTLTLELGAVGAQAKVAQVSVVFKSSSGSNVRVNVTLLHGPNGRKFTTHSEVIGTDAAPVAIPTEELLVGDADPDIILDAFLALDLTLRDSAATTLQWALVDVYLMLKPF